MPRISYEKGLEQTLLYKSAQGFFVQVSDSSTVSRLVPS